MSNKYDSLLDLIKAAAKEGSYVYANDSCKLWHILGDLFLHTDVGEGKIHSNFIREVLELNIAEMIAVVRVESGATITLKMCYKPIKLVKENAMNDNYGNLLKFVRDAVDNNFHVSLGSGKKLTFALGTLYIRTEDHNGRPLVEHIEEVELLDLERLQAVVIIKESKKKLRFTMQLTPIKPITPHKKEEHVEPSAAHEEWYKEQSWDNLILGIGKQKREAEEFMKYDDGKLMYSLIPQEVLDALASVLTYGAKKYEAHNWKKVDDPTRYEDALHRHLAAWRKGEALDTESGLPHLHHALTNLAFLVYLNKGE